MMERMAGGTTGRGGRYRVEDDGQPPLPAANMLLRDPAQIRTPLIEPSWLGCGEIGVLVGGQSGASLTHCFDSRRADPGAGVNGSGIQHREDHGAGSRRRHV